jgi:hypothetical protein
MRLTLPALLCVALALSACGSGGESRSLSESVPSPLGPVTVTVRSSATLDGYVSSGGYVGIEDAIIVGDDYMPILPGYALVDRRARSLRGFVSFELTDIPAGAQVSFASLTLTQFAMEGDPFSTMGAVVLDLVDYGTQLEGASYHSAFPDLQGFAVLSPDYSPGPRTASVTEAVQACVASGALRCQFRLRFMAETDGDTSRDVVHFRSWETGATPAQAPTLTVTYTQ